MERRRFLKLGCAGTAVAAVSPGLGWAQTGRIINLTIEPVDNEMIDGTFVFMLAYFLNGERARPVIRAREGATLTISIRNNDIRPHAFAITGIPSASIAPMAPGALAAVTFVAPVGGSYIYYDPSNAPVNRLVGLHGAFIVLPRLGTTPNGSPTPYSRSRQTRAIQSVFDVMGQPPAYPGNKWNPTDPTRDKVWILSQTDPSLNARVERGEEIDGTTVRSTFQPRYFHVNWLSGFDTADHNGTAPSARAAARLIGISGRQGQPTLIRTLNAGLALHSLHIHGNHVFALTDVETTEAQNIIFETNVFERDTWRLQPLDRRDVLLPLDKPRDIPRAKWPPKEEPFPLRYVIHCHTEMSQTAAGGSYPMGLVTHWEMTAPLQM